jgi:hypothetical protein
MSEEPDDVEAQATTRPKTGLDRTTLAIVAGLIGGLALLIILNMN